MGNTAPANLIDNTLSYQYSKFRIYTKIFVAKQDPRIDYISYIYLGYFVCVSVIHNCGTLCYSFSFNNQTDQRDETEGLEMRD